MGKKIGGRARIAVRLRLGHRAARNMLREEMSFAVFGRQPKRGTRGDGLAGGCLETPLIFRRECRWENVQGCA
jgi:hypothetical protein